MATAVATPNQIPRGRVLIVDVVAVTSGAEALAYLARDTPALMLLDLNMDDMSGWEVMSEVQRDPRLRDMKTVIVSGEQSPRSPRKFGYMKTPFRLEALFEMLGFPQSPQGA